MFQHQVLYVLYLHDLILDCGSARAGNAAGSEHVLSTCMLGRAAVAFCIMRSWVSAHVQGDTHEFMVQNAQHAGCQHMLTACSIACSGWTRSTQRTGHNRPGTDMNAALTNSQQSKRIRLSLSAADVWIQLGRDQESAANVDCSCQVSVALV